MSQFGTHIGNGFFFGAAALSIADAFRRLRAVLFTGGIVIGGIFPHLMPQGGVQQLCGDFRAAAAQVSDRGVIEAGCRSAGFQGHALVGMGTAAVLVQQLFGGILALVCAGGVVANGAGGQIRGVGGAANSRCAPTI